MIRIRSRNPLDNGSGSKKHADPDPDPQHFFYGIGFYAELWEHPFIQAVDAELEEMTKAAENLTVATDFSLFQMNAHFANVRFRNIFPLLSVRIFYSGSFISGKLFCKQKIEAWNQE